MEETSVSIVTSNSPTDIQFGIWGILPHCYNKEWKYFQNFENTLVTDLADVQEGHWLFESLRSRRCYVVITGYFSYLLEGKNLKPIYANKKSEKLICLAGIYNQTEDGFITFTLLSKKANPFQSKTSFAPIAHIIMTKKERDFWVGNNELPNTYLNFLESLQSVFLNQYEVDPLIMGNGKKTMQMLDPYEE